MTWQFTAADWMFWSRISALEKGAKAMDARIQAAIDDITATKGLQAKAGAAIALMGTQIVALQQQITDIQSKGDSATSADLDTLKASADSLVESNTALQAVLPVAAGAGSATGGNSNA